MGEPLDEEVVGLACELVKGRKGLVRALYVICVPRRLPLDAEIALEAARGEQVLQQMEKVGKAHKCIVEGEILQARDIGPAVVEEALQREADVIVIGTSYQERFGAATLGDVVPYLLKHSPCRVVVYRDAPRAGITANGARWPGT
jgi:nucleotide-binding universal stress UspA family protein